MKTYFGVPLNGGSGPQQAGVMDGEKVRSLPLHLDVVNHAAGFAWGKRKVVPGKDADPGFLIHGAAQLALAILCDLLADTIAAKKYHLRVKLRLIEKLVRGEPWQITEEQIRKEMADIQAIEADNGTKTIVRAAMQEAGPVERETGQIGGGSIKWDTDERGNKIIHQEDEQ